LRVVVGIDRCVQPSTLILKDDEPHETPHGVGAPNRGSGLSYYVPVLLQKLLNALPSAVPR